MSGIDTAICSAHFHYCRDIMSTITPIFTHVAVREGANIGLAQTEYHFYAAAHVGECVVCENGAKGVRCERLSPQWALLPQNPQHLRSQHRLRGLSGR